MTKLTFIDNAAAVSVMDIMSPYLGRIQQVVARTGHPVRGIPRVFSDGEPQSVDASGLSTALPVVFGLVGVSGRIRGISGKDARQRLTNGLIAMHRHGRCSTKHQPPKRYYM